MVLFDHAKLIFSHIIYILYIICTYIGYLHNDRYFICTILICFRSPQKRILDENYGKRIVTEQVVGSATTDQTGTDIICDPEQGEETTVQEPKIISLLKVQEQQAVSSGSNSVLGIEKREYVSSITKNGNTTPQIIEHGEHIRTTSDVTWSTEPTYTTRDRSRILSPPPTRIQEEHQKLSEVTEDSEESDLDWSSHGRPIIVTINDSGQGISRGDNPLAFSYSDGSTLSTKPPMLSKGTGSGGNKSSTKLPPRHTQKTNSHNQLKSSSESVHSKISKISLSDSQASDVSTLSAGQGPSGKTSAAPTIVSIPRRRIKSSPAKSRSSPGNRKQHQYAKKRISSREDRNDIYLNTNEPHSVTPGSHNSGNRYDAKRELLLDGWLPRLDEMSASRSLEDHGDLINQCVRDLQASFADDNRFRTL